MASSLIFALVTLKLIFSGSVQESRIILLRRNIWYRMSSSTDTGIRAIDSWGLIKEFGLILREDKPIMITNWSGKKGQNILIITIKNVDVSFSIIIVRYTDKINSLLFTNISEKMTFQHFKYFSLFRDVLPHFFPTFSFSHDAYDLLCTTLSVISHAKCLQHFSSSSNRQCLLFGLISRKIFRPRRTAEMQ